jgi:hypothetical protein
MKNIILFTICLILLNSVTTSFAIEVSPKISDREIVEKLATLQAGQAALRSEMKSGQAALGKRMDDMNKRMGDMNNTMLTLFLGLMSLIVALFAYIAWDRRTMTKPIMERLDHLEQEFKHDLDIGHADGSKLTRLIKAMRELSKNDAKVASVLRSFSLL